MVTRNNEPLLALNLLHNHEGSIPFSCLTEYQLFWVADEVIRNVEKLQNIRLFAVLLRDGFMPWQCRARSGSPEPKFTQLRVLHHPPDSNDDKDGDHRHGQGRHEK